MNIRELFVQEKKPQNVIINLVECMQTKAFAWSHKEWLRLISHDTIVLTEILKNGTEYPRLFES